MFTFTFHLSLTPGPPPPSKMGNKEEGKISPPSVQNKFRINSHLFIIFSSLCCAHQSFLYWVEWNKSSPFHVQ
uniref:Uncharacterized protein n=1 Tax=Anguilla anguilla TaxID=7936 RepID=A0A0E9U2I3_ANGAN